MDSDLTSEKALARELRSWRDRKGLTAQQLAARVADLGGKLTRQAISKIENGDRGVSLDELLLLGRGLGIPPILLVFPVGRQTEVEVLPGFAVDTFDAALWFTGEAPFPGPDPAAAWEEWEQGSVPMALYRGYRARIKAWRNCISQADLASRQLANATDEEARSRLQARLSQARTEAEELENPLRGLRSRMREHGLTPPPLPPELAHLDADPLARAIANHYGEPDTK